MEGTIGFFASLGFGAMLTYIVAYGEFLGGIAIALGVATRFFGGLFAIIMAVAIYSVHFKNGFNNMAGGYEFNLLLLACSVAIALVGPGKLSLHKKFCAK
jgi:putative oxidoreductase